MRHETSTFILNRNDKAYFLVEGKDSMFNGPYYHVHYEKNADPVIFKPSVFVAVHGDDKKEKVADFLNQALYNLQTRTGFDDKIDTIYNNFYSINNGVQKSSNPKKPVLSKNTLQTLVQSIYEYNEIKDILASDYVDIPFDENYDLVTPYENERVIKKVKKYNEQDEEIYTQKGIQRTRQVLN